MQCKKYTVADKKSGGIGSKIKGAGAATMTLLRKLGTRVKRTSPRKVVPILDWGLRYDFKGALLGDCIAGVTVAIMQVTNAACCTYHGNQIKKPRLLFLKG